MFGESLMNIRQTREEQLADLRLLMEAKPTLSNVDAAFTKPYKVSVLLIIIINFPSRAPSQI